MVAPSTLSVLSGESESPRQRLLAVIVPIIAVLLPENHPVRRLHEQCIEECTDDESSVEEMVLDAVERWAGAELEGEAEPTEHPASQLLDTISRLRAGTLVDDDVLADVELCSEWFKRFEDGLRALAKRLEKRRPSTTTTEAARTTA